MPATSKLLAKRMKEWGVPAPSFAPIDDDVIVWRLPPIERSTTGRLILPQVAQNPHPKGLLLAMGPRAMDFLLSNGIDVGHVVIWRHYAGSELHDHKATKRLESEILILKAKDILGSDELKKELESGKAKYVKGADGRHCLQRQLPGGKVAKVLALAASTSSEAEAETAKNIAAEMQRKGA